MIHNRLYAEMRFYSVLGDCILCRMLAGYQKLFAVLLWIPDSVTDIRSINLTWICRYMKICVQNKTNYAERSSLTAGKKPQGSSSNQVWVLFKGQYHCDLFQFSSLEVFKNALKYSWSRHLEKNLKVGKKLPLHNQHNACSVCQFLWFTELHTFLH